MAEISIREVARLAGVSLGTVSNVLNRRDSVATHTRQRVLDAIAELGYVRNDSARHLRAGRSRTVAIVVLDVSNPFFTDVVRGAEAVVEESGGMLVVCNSGEDPSREGRHLDLLEEQRVRGLLITPVDSGRHERLERLVERGIPVVLVDRGAGQANRCSVAVDDVLGGRMAAEHLVEGGHRRIAFVGGPFTIAQVSDRHAGAAAVLSGLGLELQVLGTKSLSVTAGREAAETICSQRPGDRVSAVFCANDLLALGVLQGLTAAGVRVPDDVALVGYDDIDFAAAAAVPLTSIRQPREQLGRTAAQLLLEEAEDDGRHRHRHLEFQPQLVVRRSTVPGTAAVPRRRSAAAPRRDPASRR